MDDLSNNKRSINDDDSGNEDTSISNRFKVFKVSGMENAVPGDSSLLKAMELMLKKEIKSSLEETVSKVVTPLMEPLATRNDVLEIRKKVEKQTEVNKAVDNRLEKLENRMERLEKRNKINNLRITNVALSGSALDVAKDVFHNIMHNSTSMLSIRRAVVLQRYGDRKATILVELVEPNMVGLVFKNIKNLKGLKIEVEKDLTEGEMVIKRKLMDLKDELLKKNANFKVFVNDTHIKDENNIFYLRNGELEPKNAGLDVENFFMKNFQLNIRNFLQSIF